MDKALADWLCRGESLHLYHSIPQERSRIEAVFRLCVTHILSKFVVSILAVWPFLPVINRDLLSNHAVLIAISPIITPNRVYNTQLLNIEFYTIIE